MSKQFDFGAIDPSGRLTYEKSDDKTSVSIKIDAKDIGVPELEDLIARLGLIRAQMTPAVPVSIDESYPAPVPYLDNLYMWKASPDAIPSLSGALMVLRSPMYGYQQFPASAEFCSGLIAWLQGEDASLKAPHGQAH